MVEFIRCVIFNLVALLVFCNKVETFTEIHHAKLNEVGIRVCEYRGLRWLKGNVEFLDECMRCSCNGQAMFTCSSIGLYYSKYPKGCKPVTVGCSQKLVMADHPERECVFIEPVSMIGK